MQIFHFNNNKITYTPGKGLLLLFLLFSLFAQAQILGSRVDKPDVEVGEPNMYRIFVTGTGDKKIAVPDPKTFLPYHFEILSDSVHTQKDTYERIIKFAVMEEGTFTIPEITVQTGDKAQKTVSYELKVRNNASATDSPADNILPDEVSLGWGDYWELYKFYILGALSALALLIAIIFIAKYIRAERSEPKRALNSALKELSQLKKKKYLEKGDYRSYYVELIDLTRNYLTKRFSVPADVLLTDDLIVFLRNKQILTEETTAKLSAVLVRGDQVKFAKIYPNTETAEKDYQTVKTMLKETEPASEEKYRESV